MFQGVKTKFITIFGFVITKNWCCNTLIINLKKLSYEKENFNY